jgi:hypothetical protein
MYDRYKFHFLPLGIFYDFIRQLDAIPRNSIPSHHRFTQVLRSKLKKMPMNHMLWAVEWNANYSSEWEMLYPNYAQWFE